MRSRALQLRLCLIGMLVVAAVVSVIGNKTDSRLVNWLGFVAFLIALCLYGAWRRAVHVERGGTVFQQERHADETRTRPDQ